MTATFPDKRHDHQACIRSALTDADRLCRDHGVRLTAIRKRVLELVWSGHKPSGAYDILDALKRDGQGAAPPTVYRALEFLMHNGLVHRIESLNAYVGCNAPGHAHDGMFLICRSCGMAAEVESQNVDIAINTIAKGNNFTLDAVSLEAIGQCPDCRNAGMVGSQNNV